MADLPVKKCKCGADCSWCIVANKARAAFPRAKPGVIVHDSALEDDHECEECFMKRGDLTVITCSEIREWER